MWFGYRGHKSPDSDLLTDSERLRSSVCVFGLVVRIRYACVYDNCCLDQTSKQENFSRCHVVCGIRVLCPRSAAPRRRRWNVSVVVSAVCSIGAAKFSMRVLALIVVAGERTNKPESHAVLWFVFISLFIPPRRSYRRSVLACELP